MMSAKEMFYPEGKKFSKAEERAFAREELVYNVTEDILLALEDLGINKKELAHRLGKSRSYVTQLLSGARNMTLGSLSDICFAIDMKLKVALTNEVIFDSLETSESIDWENEQPGIEIDDLIEGGKDVIDCRDHPNWERQEAA